MDFKQAIKLLKDEKKIKRYKWGESDPLYLKLSNGIILGFHQGAQSFQFDSESVLMTHWTVKELNQSMPFEEAFEYLLKGYKLSLPDWEDSVYVQKEHSYSKDIIKIYQYYIHYMFSTDDFVALDWLCME